MAPRPSSTFIQSLDHARTPTEPRVGAMLAIFGVSLLAVSFPSLSKRIKYLRIPRVVFFVGKHFGTGVILSTAFCHLLQDAFEALSDKQVKNVSSIGDYTGLIILTSLLSIFLVEYVSTSYVDRMQAESSAPPTPSHSPARTIAKSTPPTVPDESTPLLSATTSTPVVSARPSLSRERGHSVRRSKSFCYGSQESGRHAHPESHNTHTHNHGSSDTLFDGHHRYEQRGYHERSLRNVSVVDEIIAVPVVVVERGRQTEAHGRPHAHGQHVHVGHTHGHDINFDWEDEEEPHEVRVGEKRQVVGILVLQMGIMIHSLVIGLTLAITSGSEFTTLVTAIIFHQLFEGLSLGIRIASLPAFRDEDESMKTKMALLKPTLAALFAVTTPVGILLGIASFTESGDDMVHMKLTQGIMSAISAGMLIYAACVEMLAADFVMDPALWRSGIGRQVLAVGSLLAGVVAMALIE